MTKANSTVHYLPSAVPASCRFEAFKERLPLRVAAARQGARGYVTLDFGDECGRDTITGEAQYDWHLWVYMCDWDLFKGQSRILWRRESDNALAGAVLGQLAGECLEAIEYDAADDYFLMKFSGGYALHIDPDFYGFEPTDDLFMLFKYGESDCVSYSPERRFYRAA
jgi:hypothetical protein